MVSIISEKCTGCGLCENACPFGGISVRNHRAVLLPECTGCGTCVLSCPKKAIFMDAPATAGHDAASGGIFVIIQTDGQHIRQVSLELLGCARRLAASLDCPVTALTCPACIDSNGSLPGNADDDNAQILIAHGADHVIIMDGCPPENDAAVAYAASNIIREKKPEILLIGATLFGRALAPRIAAKLKTGLTADCTGLDIDHESGMLIQTRPAFGGNLMASILCPDRRPQMATVRPKIFPVPKPDSTRRGTAEHISAFPADELMPILLHDITDEHGDINIADAQIVVGAGKGIGGREGIKMVQDLADALGGVVAASRAIVDTGWLPYSRQVGQTGKTISPKLYIACGISGAVQHMIGLANIQTIVAVNNDPDAPIFQSAHYGIVGDCNSVLPALTHAVRAIKKR